MIGIIGAMKIETDALKALVQNKTTEVISGIEFVSGTVGAHRVVVAQCGIGKVFAALCAQTMILHFGVTRLINVGVAGTLSESVGLLDTVVATSLVQHDMDTSPLGDPVGLISGINIVHIPTSPALVAAVTSAAARAGMKVITGTVASGDQFIADRAAKDRIRDSFGASACEREGAAIAHVCYVGGVECAVIRTISDNADDTAGTMEYPELCVHAAKQSQLLLDEFFKA